MNRGKIYYYWLSRLEFWNRQAEHWTLLILSAESALPSSARLVCSYAVGGILRLRAARVTRLLGYSSKRCGPPHCPGVLRP
jgi:hypothetical protein